MSVIETQSLDTFTLIRLQNGKVNAISHELLDAANEALDHAEERGMPVVITGQDGMFSGGFDLKEMMKGIDEAKALVKKGSEFSVRLLSFPLPVIAACSGHAIAMGSFLLLSADYRLGVAGPFKIGLNEVQIGMTMHHFGIEIAKARLTPLYAERSVIHAEIYNPQEAKAVGFLDEVMEAADLMPGVSQLVDNLSQLNPKAYRETKLKFRNTYLGKLRKAIELDMESISLPKAKQ